MNIGIIGAGKVGVTIGKYLSQKNIHISGYFSRTQESVNIAALFTNTKVYENISKLAAENDVLFVAVPDDEIVSVWHELRKNNLNEKIVCHFSGAISSKCFESSEELGVFTCSLHPMFAFKDKFSSYKNMENVQFVMEGNERAVEVLKEMFENCGHKIHIMSTENKEKYHAAAALVSNHVVALLDLGLNLLGECGFDEVSSRELIKPLVIGNVNNVMDNGCVQSLTGPIERNDIQTVKKHLSALQNNMAFKSYIETAKIIVKIAEQKNPNKDYSELIELLDKN